MDFIEKIELLMKERNINRAELSRGSDVPYTTIVNFYEKGVDNIKLSTLKKLSDYFNCSLDYLVDDSVSEPTPVYEIETIAAHHEGKDWTEEELEEIERFKEFVKMRRSNQQ